MAVNTEVPKKIQNQHKRIRRNVEESYGYFKDNCDRFHSMRNFAFRSALSESERLNLDELERPPIECNILEAMISRLRGEFASQEPSILIHSEDGAIQPQMIDTIEGNFRHILKEANTNSFDNDVMKDMLSGGFSVLKVYPQYVNDQSFDQEIKWSQVRNPTMCGFDPMAQYSHKGDGQYCWEVIPIKRADFKKRYPKINIEGIQFSRTIEGIAWSYQNQKTKTLLICDYYEKKEKKVKLLYAADNKSYSPEEYEDLVEAYKKSTIAQPPEIIKERWSKKITICFYRFIENQIIDYRETDYAGLPLIFADGNSIMLQETGGSGTVTQFTRPYIYHAIGLQQLKNIAMQTFADEIEMMPPNKFLLAEESIPTQSEFIDAWVEPQKKKTLVYKSQSDDESGRALPSPMPVPRVPMPPEVAQAFMATDRMLQNVLGNYAPDLGSNNTGLSGKAIIEGASNSNASSMPYIMGFLAALNQAAQMTVKMLPKYMGTPRTIPVITKEGKRSFTKINQPRSPLNFSYDSNALKVSVEPGVNFEAQKTKSLNMIVQLLPVLPALQDLMNNNISYVLDNLDIRNVDVLKKSAEEMTKQKKIQQQQQAQQGAMNNPIIMKMQLEQQKMVQENQHKSADIQVEQQKIAMQNDHKMLEMQLQKAKLENEQLKMALSEKQSMRDALVQSAKMNTETNVKAAELAMMQHDQDHSHGKDLVELLHKITIEDNKNETRV